MIKSFGNEMILYNWLRNKDTIEFLGIWEQLNNTDFNPLEFDRFKSEAGSNRFFLSPKKWIETTADAIFDKAPKYQEAKINKYLNQEMVIILNFVLCDLYMINPLRSFISINFCYFHVSVI